MEPSREHHTPSAGSRLPALDGVRGLAALVVVIHHALLASSAALATTMLWYAGQPTGLAGLMTSSPLRIVWAGHEAVIVFFVLSGVVLTLPRLEGRAPRWRAYAASRAVRLYLPIWGAIALAAAAHVLVGWGHHGTATWYIAKHGAPVTLSSALHDASVSGEPSAAYVAALWSMRWEVAFSALLPLYVVAARRAAGQELAGGVVAIALILIAGRHDALAYLPVFFLGALLARRRTELADAMARWGRARTAAALGAALVLLTARGWAADLSMRTIFGEGLADALVAAGATLLVALAIGAPGLARALQVRPLRWLGSRSFALYLSHEVVVVSLAVALGGTPAMLPYLLLVVPLSLLVAELFFRAVERPSHRLARRVGRRLDAARSTGACGPLPAAAPALSPAPAPASS